MLSKGKIHLENLEITCGCHHQVTIHFQQKGGKILRHAITDVRVQEKIKKFKIY